MPDPMDTDNVNQAIAEALRRGAEILTPLFTANYNSHQKADETLVTDADLAVHKFILGFLSERFPGVCVDSEEARASDVALSKSTLHWILDPLDGTDNFATLNPHFGIALGLVSQERVIAGGIIQPFTNVFFSFGGAQGPLLNGKAFPRREAVAASMEEARVAFIPTATSHRTEFARRAHARIYKSCRRLIDNWAPALDWCGLASGRIDAIVSFGEAELDAHIGKALFKSVWEHEACIERHLIDVQNVPNVLEIASRSPALVRELQVLLMTGE